MDRPSKRERFNFYNNLVGVVKGLEGCYTTIDLQNEGCLTGRIIHVDGFMNIELEDTVVYDARGLEHPFENFYVNARLIRYVHIPNDQPALEIIGKQTKKLAMPQKPKIESTFRMRRAQRYHQEIVEGMVAVAGTSKDGTT